MDYYHDLHTTALDLSIQNSGTAFVMPEILAELEASLIRIALKRSRGCIPAAAIELGIERTRLQTKVKNSRFSDTVRRHHYRARRCVRKPSPTRL